MDIPFVLERLGVDENSPGRFTDVSEATWDASSSLDVSEGDGDGLQDWETVGEGVGDREAVREGVDDRDEDGDGCAVPNTLTSNIFMYAGTFERDKLKELTEASEVAPRESSALVAPVSHTDDPLYPEGRSEVKLKSMSLYV